MLFLSDLPDEQLALSVPLVKELSELEISIRDDEAQLKVQKEILSFLLYFHTNPSLGKLIIVDLS